MTAPGIPRHARQINNPTAERNPASGQLFIINPLAGKGADNLFSTHPATGNRAYYGEYLINAQGEDVVAGIRTPQYLTRAAREEAGAIDEEIARLEDKPKPKPAETAKPAAEPLPPATPRAGDDS